MIMMTMMLIMVLTEMVPSVSIRQVCSCYDGRKVLLMKLMIMLMLKPMFMTIMMLKMMVKTATEPCGLAVHQSIWSQLSKTYPRPPYSEVCQRNKHGHGYSDYIRQGTCSAPSPCGEQFRMHQRYASLDLRSRQRFILYIFFPRQNFSSHTSVPG